VEAEGKRSLDVQLNALFRDFDSAVAARVVPPPALTSHCMRSSTCTPASTSIPTTDPAARPVARLSSVPSNFGGGPMGDQAASSLVAVTLGLRVASSAARSPGRWRWPLTPRNCLAASRIPAAIQRSTIWPARQRLTWRCDHGRWRSSIRWCWSTRAFGQGRRHAS
jgi:hypothetical protein